MERLHCKTLKYLNKIVPRTVPRHGTIGGTYKTARNGPGSHGQSLRRHVESELPERCSVQPAARTKSVRRSLLRGGMKESAVTRPSVKSRILTIVSQRGVRAPDRYLQTEDKSTSSSSASHSRDLPADESHSCSVMLRHLAIDLIAVNARIWRCGSFGTS